MIDPTSINPTKNLNIFQSQQSQKAPNKIGARQINTRPRSNATTDKTRILGYRLNQIAEKRRENILQKRQHSKGPLNSTSLKTLLKYTNIDSPQFVKRVAELYKMDPQSANTLLSEIPSHQTLTIATKVFEELNDSLTAKEIVLSLLKKEVDETSESDKQRLLRENTTPLIFAKAYINKYLPKALEELKDISIPSKGSLKVTDKNGENKILDKVLKGISEKFLLILKKKIEDPQSVEFRNFIDLCREVGAHTEKKFKGEGYKAGMSLLMLRGVNPMIFTPEKYFGSEYKYDTKNFQQKNAILVTKVLQNIANEVEFESGKKEPEMVIMNDFVKESIAKDGIWSQLKDLVFSVNEASPRIS